MKYLITFLAGGAALFAALFGWNYYEKNFRDADLYQSLGEGLSQSLLRDVVLRVENYRLVFGFYPASMEDLRGGVFHSDPASRKCASSTDYYYELGNGESTYYLFSKGRDCKEFTEDDLYPELKDKEMKNIGLRIPTRKS